MADALAVHPAAILVAALVGANLIGITGMILAAPVLATIQLLFRYVFRKLFDRDPWEGIDLETHKKPEDHLPIVIKKIIRNIDSYLQNLNRRNDPPTPSR